MQNEPSLASQAMAKAIEKVVEEHRKSGEPMVISDGKGSLQWVVPQADGSMKVVREERIAKP